MRLKRLEVEHPMQPGHSEQTHDPRLGAHQHQASSGLPGAPVCGNQDTKTGNIDGVDPRRVDVHVWLWRNIERNDEGVTDVGGRRGVNSLGQADVGDAHRDLHSVSGVPSSLTQEGSHLEVPE